MMLMVVNEGIVGILLLVRVRKNKGKESQALPTEKKRGKNKSNHPDDEPAGKKTNYYYYYGERCLRRDLILLSFDSLPCQTVKIFIIKFPQFER